MPTKHFAFEIICEELVNPPVVALLKLTTEDLAYLQSKQTAFLMMKQEDPSLVSMTYSNGIICFYLEEHEALAPLSLALAEAKGARAIDEVTYKFAHKAAEESNGEHETLTVYEEGVVFEACVKHTDVAVACPLLTWKELFKDPTKADREA